MMADGYKNTEIGVIPNEWEVERFDNEVELIGSGISNFTGEKAYLSTSSIHKTKIVDIEEYITYNKRPSRANMEPILNSIWFAKMKNTNKFYIFDNPKELNNFILSTGFFGLKAGKNLKSKYLYQYIMSDIFINKKNKSSKGTTQEAINNEILKNFKIPLPPLKEQEKIADILSTADNKIDAIASQIKKAQTLKKGLLQKLLSEGIGHSEFKDSELGKIPKSWEVDGLGKIANITKLAGYEFTEHFDYEAGGNIIALRALNVVNGKLNLNSVQRVSEEISNKLPRSKLYINDILMTYVGTLGEFAIIEEDDKFHLAPNVAKITMNSQDINISKYILFYLMSNVGQKQIKLLSTTTSQPAINMENIRKIKIPLPPLEEQKKIAEILSTADEKLEVLISKKEKYETLKKGLLQKLLSGEVRV